MLSNAGLNYVVKPSLPRHQEDAMEVWTWAFDSVKVNSNVKSMRKPWAFTY